MAMSKNNESDLQRIAKLELELYHMERQPARSSAEGSEIACRCDELRRLIQTIRDGQLNVGHP
jgi:hypothetical protein